MGVVVWCSNTKQTTTQTKRLSQAGGRERHWAPEGFWKPLRHMGPRCASAANELRCSPLCSSLSVLAHLQHLQSKHNSSQRGWRDFKIDGNKLLWKFTSLLLFSSAGYVTSDFVPQPETWPLVIPTETGSAQHGHQPSPATETCWKTSTQLWRQEVSERNLFHCGNFESTAS